MKKYISIATLYLFISIQSLVFATSPCTTSFAFGYAVAQRDYAAGLADCDFALLSGPCKEEVRRSNAYTISNLYSAFSGCCCASGLSECCN
jgi:hypothetical protein